MNAPGQRREHFPRPALDDVRRALPHHALDGLHPPHRRRRLAHQGVLDGGRVALHFHVHVVDHGEPRRGNLDPREIVFQPLAGGPHQHRMKRRAHRQRHRALRAARLAKQDRPVDRVLLSGDHDLSGRVEVHGLDLAEGFRAPLAHAFLVQAQNRRHRALALGHCLLHRLGAEAHQRQGVPEGKGAGGHQRSVLAETVSRRQLRRRAAEPTPRAVGRVSRRDHRRLRVDRLVQRFGRAFIHQPYEFAA